MMMSCIASCVVVAVCCSNLDMDTRDTKLRKLNQFRRKLPHQSASALSATLDLIEQEGMPELHSRKDLRNARNLTCDDDTPFGPIIQSMDVIDTNDVTQRVGFAHPFAALWTALTISESFRLFFEERLAACPCSPENPWSLVFYSDEVTPGNPLSPANHRKFQAVYWTFLEFGAHGLSREECWFCMITLFSDEVKKLHGGMSQLMKCLIKQFFGVFNVMIGGIALPVGRFWARLRVLVQDGDAHVQTWCQRGSKGSKVCLLCGNLFAVESDMVDTDGTKLLACAVIRERDLVRSSDEDLRNNARWLEEQKHHRDFKLYQQALGITYHPESILLDRTLDDIVAPSTQYVHDWMHCLVANGVYNTLIYLLFEAFFQAGRTNIYEAFEGYLKLWRWPAKHHSAHLPEIFCTKRAKSSREAKHIKCQASDLLAISPVLAYFVQAVLLPTGLCTNECNAFLAINNVLEFISSVNRGKITADMIGTAVESFLELFVSVWGVNKLIPKMHWLLHFRKHFQRYELLIACFVTERYHRHPKRYASEMKNTRKSASNNVLKEVVCHMLVKMQSPNAFNFNVGLVDGRPASDRVRARIFRHLDMEDDGSHIVNTANESRFNRFGTCKTNDIVLLHDPEPTIAAAKALLHVEINGEPLSLVSLFLLKSIDRDAGYSEWHSDSNPTVFSTGAILDTVTTSQIDAHTTAVLLPCDFR